MLRLHRFAIKDYRYAVMGYSLFKAAKSKYNKKKHSVMKKLILLLLIIPFLSFGQTHRELELCLALQSRSFSLINEADDALEKVLSVTGLKNNFKLTPCDGIQNAHALTVQCKIYIS